MMSKLVTTHNYYKCLLFYLFINTYQFLFSESSSSMVPHSLQPCSPAELLDLFPQPIMPPQEQPVDESQPAHNESESKKNKQEGKKKRAASKLAGKKNGHWELEENKKYHWFLEIYHTHFLKKHLRRVDRIFKVMENFLGTREAEQCRSHHQKMEKRHGDFKNILLHLRRQHYSSQETHVVLEDIEKNDVKLIDGLVEREELYSTEAQKEEEM